MSETELRVLIVDDSALFRQSVASALREIRSVTVVGTAKDGREAIEKVQQLAPDLLTLDVEMPILNGIETLREMKRLRLKSRAIMLSSLTETGAKVTLDALFEGAFDFITKPTGGLFQSRDLLRTSLTEKIAAFRVYYDSHHRTSASVPTEHSSVTSLSATDLLRSDQPPCELVVLGSSTGGPQTLRTVMPKFDADFAVPFIVVQHMPANYTQSMAQRLDEVSPLNVREASDGEIARAGSVYIAPGGKHLQLRRHGGAIQLKLSDAPPENSCRPSVDFTLRSAIDTVGGNLLAVILTGMGKDGLAGCRKAKAAGATVFAQDEATSAVFGMPKAVIDAGLANRVLSLGKVAPAITRHVHRSRQAEAP